MNYGPAILGVSVTLMLAVLALFFRAGHLAARIEELERWRLTIRSDMHEVSDLLGTDRSKIENLSTLMLERTNRQGREK